MVKSCPLGFREYLKVRQLTLQILIPKADSRDEKLPNRLTLTKSRSWLQYKIPKTITSIPVSHNLFREIRTSIRETQCHLVDPVICLELLITHRKSHLNKIRQGRARKCSIKRIFLVIT